MNALASIFADFPRLFADAKVPDAPEPMAARIDAHFDTLDAEIARIHAQMVADGLPTRHYARTREGERS